MTILNMREIEPKLLKNISKIAKKENTTETRIINQTIQILQTISEIVEKDNTPTETKIMIKTLETALKIQGKKEIETTKNENKNEFLEMGGIFTTDKPFSAVEDRKKMRNGEL